MGVKFGAAALLIAFGSAYGLGLKAYGDLPEFSASLSPKPYVLSHQKTTKDGLYAAEQATRGAELYVKHCERCHTPEKVPAGKKPGPPIVGDKFLDTWRDRTVGELFDTVLNTMPSDGSVTLTADQALDSTAHILKANGFPAGKAPMKNDDAMKSALIVK
ncbi:MAG TPA: cytochrome c [Vicinamibacterales bacterium]|nr:cytochrome c [Vicinamibacterales bacterium]